MLQTRYRGSLSIFSTSTLHVRAVPTKKFLLIVPAKSIWYGAKDCTISFMCWMNWCLWTDPISKGLSTNFHQLFSEYTNAFFKLDSERKVEEPFQKCFSMYFQATNVCVALKISQYTTKKLVFLGSTSNHAHVWKKQIFINTLDGYCASVSIVV